MKFYKKILLIFLIINFTFLCFGLNKNEAATEDKATITITDIEDKASEFINKGKGAYLGNENIIDSVTKNFSGIGQLLTLIGAGVMVVVVTYMGIKYLTSAPDKQAALKQQLIGVVVAGVVIFGAYGIWSSLVKLLSQIG